MPPPLLRCLVVSLRRPAIHPPSVFYRSIATSVSLKIKIQRPKPQRVAAVTNKRYGEQLSEHINDWRTLGRIPKVFSDSLKYTTMCNAFGLQSFFSKHWFLRTAAEEMRGVDKGRGGTPRDAAEGRFKVVSFLIPHHVFLTTHHPRETGLIEVVANDELYGEAQYVMGELALYSAEYWRLGEFMLRTAAEVGHVGASVKLAQLERAKVVEASPRAKQVIRDAAEAETDWQAMIMYALDLVRYEPVSRSTREKAYALVKRAFDITEPSSMPDNDRSYEKISPWRAVHMFADDNFKRTGAREDRDLMQEALIAGAYKYKDPDACWLLANSEDVTVYSEDWVELMTKAAMAGKPEHDPSKHGPSPPITAADRLAKYYLEKDRWYPCKAEPVVGRARGLGFDWLAIAAHVHVGNPESLRLGHLKIAMVLRESGLQAEGLDVLKFCRVQLENFPANESSKAAAKARLNTFIDAWDGKNGGIPRDSETLWLLGPPEMRHPKAA